MRTQILLSISFIFICTASSFSQKDTIWYDQYWKETSKKDASFYRSETKKQDDGYWVVDNYMNGAKQMEGVSLDPVKEIYQGEVTWYFQNGTKFQIVHYKDGILNGHRKVYFENGKVNSEGEYKEGKKHGKWKEFYENGTLKESGFFDNRQKDAKWKTYYSNGKIHQEGKYELGKKVGVWKTHYYDGT